MKERNWLKFVGALYGEEKARFLTSGSYAIHAERDEAFGIAVPEYLKAGLLPVVPASGGACAIVDDPALTYHTVEDGARILARLSEDDGFRTARSRHCAARAAIFTRRGSLEQQHRLLTGILENAGGTER